MAIGFRAATNGTAAAADPVAAIALPTGTLAGDMVGIFLSLKLSTTTIAAQPTSWQDPANNETTGGNGADGADSGLVRVASWWREYDGAWAMPTVDLSGVPNVTAFSAMSFSKGAGEVWSPVTCADAADLTGSATLYDPPAAAVDLSLDTNDWLISHTGINGDAGTPTVPGTVTATGATLAAATNQINLSSTTGNDIRQLAQRQLVTAGPSSAGPDISIVYTTGAATMAGATIFSRLRVTTPAATIRQPHFNSPYMGRW